MEAPRKSSNGVVLHRFQQALDHADSVAALRPAREYESGRLDVDEMVANDWIIPLQAAPRVVVKVVSVSDKESFHIGYGGVDYWLIDSERNDGVMSLSRDDAKKIIRSADDVGFITFEDSSFTEKELFE